MNSTTTGEDLSEISFRIKTAGIPRSIYLRYEYLQRNIMGDVLTVVGGKGGVGKTTTAVNTALAFDDEGEDVVVVDADLGMPNLGRALSVSHQPRLHDVLAGEAELGEAITDGPGGVTLLPGTRSLEGFAAAEPTKLEPVLDQLAQSYDIVIVDTGEGISRETIVPTRVADGVLLVTTTSDVAVMDTRKISELVARVGGTVTGAVVTRAHADMDVSSVADRLDTEVLAVVPTDPEAGGTEPLVRHGADRYAAQAYRRLAGKLGERLTAAGRTPTQ